jgi:quercetin dioxygenase-like cupin family protein
VTAVLLALAILAPQRHILIDNATTTVTRVRFGRDAREAVHSNPFPLVILQLTPGDVDFAIADTRASGPREAGLVTFVAANTPYAVANAGTAPFNLITIALKPARAPASAAPPTEAPPGITRTTLVDNADVRVVRVQFAPGGREPVHTHPNDLITVQLTPGKVEIMKGSRKTTGLRTAGFVQFLPRDVEHAYASADAISFELLSISIK